MFNMQQIGINISKLRKSKGLTQMELADQLGISFQAVSNWERGVSMPDISKLSDIAAIFHVSIDEILGNKRASEITRNLIENRLVPDIQMEEIEEAAPILHQEQVEVLLDSADKSTIDVNDLKALAPFISTDILDKKVQEMVNQSGDLSDIDTVLALAPFLSQKFIDGYAVKIIEQENSLSSISALAPFISAEILDKKAQEAVEESGSLSEIEPIIPFISTKVIDHLADTFFEKTGDCSSFLSIVPFISSAKLNAIAIKSFKKDEFAGLVPIIHFLDSKIIEDFLWEK